MSAIPNLRVRKDREQASVSKSLLADEVARWPRWGREDLLLFRVADVRNLNISVYDPRLTTRFRAASLPPNGWNKTNANPCNIYDIVSVLLSLPTTIVREAKYDYNDIYSIYTSTIYTI